MDSSKLTLNMNSYQLNTNLDNFCNSDDEILKDGLINAKIKTVSFCLSDVLSLRFIWVRNAPRNAAFESTVGL